MLQALKNLPREARDTLFLLIVIAWIIAPHVNNLPVWCSAMAAGVLLWRAYLAVRNYPLPSRWWLVLGLLLATAGTLYSHRTLLGRDAGVTYIVVLLALKTLEMRARRDAFVIFFLGFFALLSNFFFSQSLLTAAAMLLGLLGLLTALVNSHMPVGRPPLLQAAKTAGWMALLGAPIMVVLFVLFPRIAPLWGVPSDAMSGRSGLSSTMQIGNIAKLALDDGVAMRVRFDTVPPQQGDLYFRGPVFSSFDGREWNALRSALPHRLALKPDLQVQGAPITYQVTLEANNRPWLLLLDATATQPKIEGYSPTMAPDLQWLVERPISDLVRYSAQSNIQFRHGPLNPVLGLQDYLDLPANFNPRTRELARTIRSEPRYARANAVTLVDAVLELLRTGGYTYTLEPGVFGAHTADEFWFDRKAGFCEHIASSFVLLLRAMDIPARIVTGYQGGALNPVDGYWTVRQSDAHAWAEVWMAGQGWVRVDPTSVVAPGRTGSFQRLQPPSGVFGLALDRLNPQLTLNLRALWEAVNNRWNQWVLNYSQNKQLNLLRNLGFESPSWADLSYALIGVVVFASLVGAAWTLWERHRQDPWLRLLHRAVQRLKKAGLELPPNAAPRRIALELQSRAADIHPSLPDWFLRLETWRYAPRTASGTSGGAVQQLRAFRALQREFRQLPWPRRIP